ncbi:hypothetical protein IPH92_05020 [Candidatus Kaiserbacteria bacterium]|nr:MAG: hypothetical protein IPH92_05020 [Candidatus Kaiserbacteria bacterium]
MKSFIKSAVITIAIGLCFVTSAFATCVSGCVTPPPPAPTQTTTFMVGGASNFGGMGGAVFQGNDGYARVEKNGYGGVDVTVDAAGNLCGIDCQSGKFKFNGYAGEHVKASAGALSTHSGVPAIAENKGSAFGNVTFGVQKTLSNK